MGPAFVFDPTTKVDVFTALAVSPDGTQLLAGAVKGLESGPGGWQMGSSTGLLFTLPIPFAETPQATSTINLPVGIPHSVDADARGVYVVGATATGGGLFVKCESSTRCPSQ